MASKRSDDFHSISSTLTGAGDLDRTLADEYLALVVAGAGADQVSALLGAYRAVDAQGGDRDALIRSRILGDPVHGPLARAVIALWFTGLFAAPGSTAAPAFADPAHYFRALIWPVIGAHPPGLSGGYFGYWAYPPEH